VGSFEEQFVRSLCLWNWNFEYSCRLSRLF